MPYDGFGAPFFEHFVKGFKLAENKTADFIILSKDSDDLESLALCQDSFTSENDEELDDNLESAVNHLSKAIQFAKHQDLGAAIIGLLDLPQALLAKLKGQKITLTLNEDGKLVSI